jgi:WD40 repeat protein
MTAEPISRPADSGTVDAENPWPGLAAFREADQERFYGREAETDELLRLVLRERLTVLFGLSGLGKTSLLQAGLFPRLRPENVLPIYIRLDFSQNLIDQVRQAILREAEAAGIEAPAFPETETLWESFHRQGADFWSPRNDLVTPLLVFDQFEEIFTIGRPDEAFLTELADLCEGSAPESLRARLAQDPTGARDYSFNRHPYKILLSLREDFLPELEGLRDRIRGIVHNRLRLQRMHGGNALRVVTEAGGHLVEPGVPEKIVRFVAGRESGDVPLPELEIEPALLSVVCRELNHERQARGLPRITSGLLEGNREEILADLYERSLTDLPREVRTFVEERLLTRSGFRDSVALESALEEPGVGRESLRRLVDRRLLRIEDRGGVQRVELTHDVLAGVIRKSRDSRREREAQEQAEAARRVTEWKLRRSRLIIGLLALVLAGVVALAWWGFSSQDKARRVLASSDVERAVSLSASRPAHALAYLARALRNEPESVVAQSLLTGLLFGKAWPRPIAELRLDGADSVHLSENGRFFAAVSGLGTVRVWDTRTLRQIGTVHKIDVAESLALSRDGRRMLIISPAWAQLWDVPTGQLLRSVKLGEKSQVLLSPDGRWLALAAGDRTLVLRQVGTNLEHRILLPEDPDLAAFEGFKTFGFSPDSRRIFATDLFEVLLWNVESGQPIPGPPPERNPDVRFSPDGRILIISADYGTRLWDAVAGGPIGEPFGRFISRAWLSPGGDKLATYNDDGTKLQIWSTRDMRGPFAEIPKRNLLHAELSRDGQLLLTTSNDGVELWDADTGLPVSQALCDCIHGHFLEGTRRVVTSDDNGVLRVWSSEPARTGTEILKHGGDFTRFSEDGSRLAIVDDDMVQLWDTEAVRPVAAPIRGPGFFSQLSSDGRFLLQLEEGMLRFWATGTGRPVWKPLPVPSGAIAFNAEREILGIRKDDKVQLWSPATGEQVGSVQPGQKVTDFAFTRSGDRIVTVSPTGDVRVWSTRTAKPLGAKIKHESPVVALDLSPDGDLIATGTRKGLIRIWDLRSGDLLVGPFQQGFQVSSVRFQAAGRLLLSSAHNSLRVWETRTGKPVKGMFDQREEIWFAQTDPTGDRLLVRTLEEIRLLDRTGQVLLTKDFPISLFPPEARFSPSGRLLWITFLGEMHVFVVPVFSTESREILARWAEAVGGWTLDDEGRLAPVRDQLARLNALRRETAGAPLGQLTAVSLVRWFLSDPRTRTSSPVTNFTVEQLIRHHLEDRDWRGAARAFPGHPLLLKERPSPVPITEDEP